MAKLIILKDKTQETFLDTEFNNFKLSKKKYIYDLKHEHNYRIFCDCSKDMAEMTINKRSELYYFSNLNKNGEKHKFNCTLHSEYSGGNDSEKGWSSDDNGDLVVNLSSTAFGKKKRKKKDEEESELARPIYSRSGSGVNTVTLLGLVTKLNIMAWDSCIRRNKGTPEDMSDLSKTAFGLANSIKLRGKDSLNNYWYSYTKFTQLGKDELLFIYMPFITIERTNHTKYHSAHLSFFNGYKESILYVYCPAELFSEAHQSIRKKDIKKEGDTFKGMVGGFIKKNRRNSPEFVSMEFIPITKDGLWCESSYEDQVYSKLIEENRLFTKGYKAIDIYGGFIPDVIFLDTEKITYGEIFGMQNIESYDERKEEKIQLASESKEDFNFWYWDVTETDTPPEFISKGVTN